MIGLNTQGCAEQGQCNGTGQWLQLQITVQTTKRWWSIQESNDRQKSGLKHMKHSVSKMYINYCYHIATNIVNKLCL